MANGDIAASAGMDVVSGVTGDIRMSYDEINKSRDYTATHQLSGTHPASAINSGVLALARIPTMDAAHLPTIPTSKLGQGNWDMGVATLTTVIVNAQSLGLSGGAGIAGDLNVNGTIATNGINDNGALSVGGQPRFPWSRSNSVTGWASIGVGADGTLGLQASAERFKQDITPHEYTLDQIAALTVVWYRLRAAVEKDGDGAPFEAGLIAEQIIEAGFPEFIVWGFDGQPFTINYDRMTVVCISGIQQLHAQQQDILTRLAKLEGSTH